MKIFLFFLLFISINSIGQKTLNNICDSLQIKKDTTIKIFIKGVGSVYELEAKFFQQEFELTSFDNNAEIVSFRLSVDSKDLMMYRANNGKKVAPDLIIDGVDKGKDFSLRFLSAGSYIFFDSIVVKKGDACFKVSPFIIKIK